MSDMEKSYWFHSVIVPANHIVAIITHALAQQYLDGRSLKFQVLKSFQS